MNYSQKRPEGPTPSDEWLSYHSPSQADDYPNLPDAHFGNGPPEQAEQAPFNPADFIVSVTTGEDVEPLSPDENQNKRQYITTHTPHAWLDRYIAYSRELSPRAFDMLHEATGLWVLSSAVAGRLLTYFSKSLRHTSFMITAVGRSSVWAKSRTVGLGKKVLKDAGLDWRFLPTDATPQAIIAKMADNKQVIELEHQLDKASDGDTTGLKKQLADIRYKMGSLYANEGQRSWHASEFGSRVIAPMMRNSGPMTTFSTFLRVINEHVNYNYSKETRGFADEVITSPSLAVMADTTPADVRPYARAGGALWTNGFFPRFAIIAPTSDEQPTKARVKYDGNYNPAAPYELTKPLADANKALELRQHYHTKLKRKTIKHSKKVEDAVYEYELHIDRNRLETEDLDGTYSRLALEQSVAIAALLAYFDGGSEVIEMRHYQRAIEICERIRRCTEDFYTRITKNQMSEKQAAQSQLEDRIISIIRKHHEKTGEWPTLNNIRKRTGNSKARRLPREDVMKVVDILLKAELLEEFKEDGKKAYRYRLL